MDPFAPIQPARQSVPGTVDPFAATPVQAPVQHTTFDPFAQPTAGPALAPVQHPVAMPHDPFSPQTSAHFAEEPFGNLTNNSNSHGNGGNIGVARPPSPQAADKDQHVVGGDGGLFDTLAANGGAHAPRGDFNTGYNKRAEATGAEVSAGATAGGGSSGDSVVSQRPMIQDNVTPLLVDKAHGECLSRISTRTMITKAWKPCFWVFDTPNVFIIFRERQHYREYCMNPFLDDATRTYLQKKRVELGAHYRCTPVTRKPYGSGDGVRMLYHFTIEEIRDYGAVPIIKLADRELDVLEEIRKHIHAVVYEARVKRQSRQAGF